MKYLVPLFGTLVLAVFSACTPEPTEETLSHCERASSELRACMAEVGETGTSLIECENWVQETEISCANEKADGLFDWMCAAGVLHYCATPICDSPILVSDNDCAQYIGADGCASCDYYLCKESESFCGSDGYYAGFGHRYCERLTLITEPKLSVAGQAWSAATRECLMTELELLSSDSDSCNEIKEIAYGSHPGCYVTNGFCELPWSDMLAVVMTVDPSDYQLRQVLGVGVGCLDRWL